MCIMFAALNIDRNNIQNAVSDNMLDDLGITHADYVSSFQQMGDATLTVAEYWTNHFSSWLPCC